MSDHLAPIIVGVDGSPASVDALRWATGIAAAQHRPVHAVTVGRSEMDADVLSRSALESAFGDRLPPNLQVVLKTGSPSEQIGDACRDAFMLIIGSRGTDGSMTDVRPFCPVVIMHHTHPAEPIQAGEGDRPAT
jgi:nucleotide-binding universal stress UspA family protein